MNHQHLNVRFLDQRQLVYAAWNDSKSKNTWCEYRKHHYKVHYGIGYICFGGLFVALRQAWAGMICQWSITACQSWLQWNQRHYTWQDCRLQVYWNFNQRLGNMQQYNLLLSLDYSRNISSSSRLRCGSVEYQNINHMPQSRILCFN